MATAFQSQATPVRTAIVHSVCWVSVSITHVAKYPVAPVKTEFLVKLECPAYKLSTLITTWDPLFMIPAKLMPEKAANYLATFASLATVFRAAFAHPLSVNLAPTSPVLNWA